jgi:hypothetical protein
MAVMLRLKLTPLRKAAGRLHSSSVDQDHEVSSGCDSRLCEISSQPGEVRRHVAD